jgi:hypothetical protein
MDSVSQMIMVSEEPLTKMSLEQQSLIMATQGINYSPRFFSKAPPPRSNPIPIPIPIPDSRKSHFVISDRVRAT